MLSLAEGDRDNLQKKMNLLGSDDLENGAGW